MLCAWRHFITGFGHAAYGGGLLLRVVRCEQWCNVFINDLWQATITITTVGSEQKTIETVLNALCRQLNSAVVAHQLIHHFAGKAEMGKQSDASLRSIETIFP